MSTVLFAAAGAAVGSAIGGSALGISAAVIGQAVGASVGAAIDARLFSSGSASVSTGQITTARFSATAEGTALPWVVGRARVTGEVIWSTRFKETIRTKNTKVGDGKNAPKVKETIYSYSVSFAIALCEGEISRIGRIWMDGQVVRQDRLTFRLYKGTQAQEPDPLIDMIEGSEFAPSYRGVAYLVFEHLPLEAYGNRIPSVTVEVYRRPKTTASEETHAMDLVQAVALIPGTGEYSLSTQPVKLRYGPGSADVMNVNSEARVPDLLASLDGLEAELPAVKAELLVVSWFGDDLRAGHCTVRPKVEQTTFDGEPHAWQVSGITRSEAQTISQTGDRVNFGGTPSDASVKEAIAELKARGHAVTFYPFILMDIPGGNALPDPYGGSEQSQFPWRGRITTDLAPNQISSTDKSAQTAQDVAAFMGSAVPGDFALEAGLPVFSGSNWGFRRMVLHYAMLCQAAGGVDAFCIGSELRGLTQLRDAAHAYPMVLALKTLAADVRTILGPDTKIGYAADWSEYFGHQPGDGSGDIYYHLDPLWSDPNIDFVGIDNYFPISDWREGTGHADADWRSVKNPDYLASQVRGGEGFDWYYASDEDRAAQLRTPIQDSVYGEDHVFRPKDLLNWWKRAHFDRPGGVRNAVQTDWVPESKPIWFTEFGCPAVDKGTNQPNVFADALSSESAVPYFSTGARDDFIQYRYIEAVLGFYGKAENNPASSLYDGSMVDMSRAHLWAWDARPWPDFPMRSSVWSDGPNHARGHWITGRGSATPLSMVLAELAERTEIAAIDTSALHSGILGMEVSQPSSIRSVLQPLLMLKGLTITERDGTLKITENHAFVDQSLDGVDLALDVADGVVEIACTDIRTKPPALQVEFFSADTAYQKAVVEYRSEQTGAAEKLVLPVVLSIADAKTVAERIAREIAAADRRIVFGLPMQTANLDVGDIATFCGDFYRIDRREQGVTVSYEGVRIDPLTYQTRYHPEEIFDEGALTADGELVGVFLDLPLMRGDEDAVAPYFVATSSHWPSAVSVYSGSDAAGFTFNRSLSLPGIIGHSVSDLPYAPPDRWDRGNTLTLELYTGALETVTDAEVLEGANLLALETSTGWELLQFRDAEYLETGNWRISHFLRGRFGTISEIPADIPAGARAVLIDAAPVQLEMLASERGLERQYRYGPSDVSFDDEAFTQEAHSFHGVGLRPYAPVHLKAKRPSGDLWLSWLRQTRIEGELWADEDVPLGEESSLFRVVLQKDGAIVLSLDVDMTELLLPSADLPGVPFDVSIQQVSARWGAGRAIRMTINE